MGEVVELPGEGTPSAGGEIDALKAVRLFAQTGSLALVARELNVPIYELKKLSRTEFWARELGELQRAEAALLNVKLTKLFDTVLEKIENRLTHGDIGPMGMRMPMNGMTLARVADSIFEKRQLIRELPTAIVGEDNKKLSLLAQRLRALGAKDIDLLDIDAQEIPFTQLPAQERAFAEH